VSYEPTGFALQIFHSRHAAYGPEEAEGDKEAKPGEPWADACKRVAWHVADAEPGPDRVKHFEEFRTALFENRLMPGGRIWYGSGKARGQLLNCFVIPTADSREGWGEVLYDTMVIAGTGGGIGANFGPIRPRNSLIRGTGGRSTGAVSLMSMQNGQGNEIAAGGGRRIALMQCLPLNHPDIIEFLDKKLDLKQLNNANVSVVFDFDPEWFFDLVKSGGDLPLMFGGKQISTIPAKDIWMRIVKNALKGGEPGILNGFLANKMSNIGYIEPLTSTNPCGEIWMSPYDCCCLGHVVLPRFVKDGEFDWDAFKATIKTGVRFLDDVLSVNCYPLPEIEAKCGQLRRIGLGVLGLHHMLIELGMKYNSTKGLEFVDKLFKFLKNESYEASIELAIEKGPFPGFEADKYLKSAFVKTLKPSIREKIKQHGIRNCALNTIAPTGTISMVCEVSSGIEPIFAMAYERRYRKGEEKAVEIVADPLFKRYVSEGRNTKNFQNSYDLSMRDHLEMQRTCQKHVDNAVSKTINLPPGTSEEELSELYMEFLPELKGVTVYPVGSREDQPLTPLGNDVAEQMVFDSILGESGGQDGCKTGACDM
jgi:ribonucleoside-diphosphate reductase alpha chain